MTPRESPSKVGDSATRAGPGSGVSPRTVDWAALSDALLPTAVRARAIAVSVSTDRDVYRVGDPIAFEVSLENRLPLPIRLRTDSPEVWTWAVDGDLAASRIPRRIPDRPGVIDFARGERKRFRRRWSQRVRTGEREWTPVEPGTYAVDVAVNREDAAVLGLTDRTEVSIEP